MSKTFNESSIEAIEQLKQRIESSLRLCFSLEEAAQKFTNLLFEEFRDSLILVRLFATIPFGQLPESYQRVIVELAENEGIKTLLQEKSLVLTLLGTSGVAEAHHNRLHLKQHLGVPLVSSAFVDSVPMVAQLLKALGFQMGWGDKQAQTTQVNGIATETIGFLAGVFYVPNAQQVVDARGNSLLTATNHAAAYNIRAISEVRTVFGIGGAYIRGPFIAVIFFSKEELERKKVEELMSLANYFKTATIRLALENRIFAYRNLKI